MRNDMIRFSRKQRQVLTWWRQNRWQAIICDGAVRSGKTFCMGLSFFLWAQSCFDGRQFALCGKTVGALRLHFTMADNPGLSPEIRQRYERLYTGVFYRRFVQGEWAAAQGLVYDFFDPARDAAPVPEGAFSRWRVSVDYGTVNPLSMGLWGERDGVWYRVEEVYYDSRREGRQKTDAEYADMLDRLAAGREIQRVIVDPSAASFIETLRQRGWRVKKANNDVADGIRVTADLLRQRRIVLCNTCRDCLREMALYCWDEKAGKDAPKKEHDHAMDEMRYFAMDLVGERSGGFAVTSVRRQA